MEDYLTGKIRDIELELAKINVERKALNKQLSGLDLKRKRLREKLKALVERDTSAVPARIVGRVVLGQPAKTNYHLCKTGKRGFNSEKAALKANRSNSHGLRTYACKVCGRYHVTKKS